MFNQNGLDYSSFFNQNISYIADVKIIDPQELKMLNHRMKFTTDFVDCKAPFAPL